MRTIGKVSEMETKILKVVQQGEAYAVQSQKAEGGQVMKCNIVLQELGGKYEDQFVGAMLGNAATCRFFPGDVVAASLRFSTHDHPSTGSGQAHTTYQDILVTDIVKLGK